MGGVGKGWREVGLCIGGWKTQSADIMGGNLCGKDRQSNCQAWALRRNKEEQWRRLQWRSGVTEASCTQMKMKAEGELHCRARTANKTHTCTLDWSMPEWRSILIQDTLSLGLLDAEWGLPLLISASNITAAAFTATMGFFVVYLHFLVKNMHTAKKCMEQSTETIS